MKRIFAACLAALAAAACSPDAPRGEAVVLTVSGAVAEPNRDALDSGEDVFLAWLGADFERARQFTAGELAALEPVSVTVDYPAGGETRRFTGPRLSAVLAAAGARGDTVTATALDGYAADIPMALIEEYDVILATRRDGAPLAMGGFGPAQVVFPRQDAAALAGMDDSLFVWGVVWIDVRSD